MDEPTEKQLAAISRLARSTKASVNLNDIKTKKDASRLIETLLAKKNGKDSNGYRDNKCAYGLAVKLIFQKSLQLNLDYKPDQFWKEVDEFYRQYIEHQDRATKPGSQG